MALEDNTKKDLAQMVRDLEAKVKELQAVEKQQSASLENLKEPAIGLSKDENGTYILVKIKYDIASKSAGIEALESTDTKDIALAFHKLKHYAGEKIMRKARGGKYDS
jgi:hypothetical protein